MKTQISLLKEGYCLSEEQWKNNKISIQGFGSSDEYKYISIDIMKCKNDTHPGIGKD